MKIRNTIAKTLAVVALCVSMRPTPAEAQGSDVDIRDLSIVGHLSPTGVVFTAKGTISTESKFGADISLLAGEVALLQPPQLKYGKLQLRDDGYHLVFDKRGAYPFEITFLAKVNDRDDRKSVAFQFLSSPIRSLRLKGFPSDTKLDVENAATPVWSEDTWVAALSPNSWIRFNWSPAATKSDGELFYTAEIANVAVVAPGMIKQNQKVTLQIMQGEMSSLTFALKGAGEISQVEGKDILGWKIERDSGNARRLSIRFNRPQTSVTSVLIRSQTALPKLPSVASPLLIEPFDVTRVGGSLLLLSDGAVNLGIVQQKNVSQISPDQFPLERSERASLDLAKRQAFAFRYAGVGQEIGLQIGDILPEVSVSSITLYHFGLNESSIDADFNLEVREAPLREYSLSLPKDYSVLAVEQAYLSDCTVADSEGGRQTLRLVFSQPIIDRQSLRIRLERNGESSATQASLPRIEPLEAKSIRGYLGVTADTGIKVARLSDSGLTEVIPSYFPLKNDQLQVAYRIRDPEWSASLSIERLSPSIQAESFHLFSLGEGVSYASSIITYQISGAPTQSLVLQLDPRYENVDLSGSNIRDWKRSGDRYTINFHSAISGTYSLLATYEYRRNSSRDAIAFDGATPLDASSESGYIAFVSPSQVEFSPIRVESPLLRLEPQELPPEYQIMIDAPILASFHFPKRPFALEYTVFAHPREQSIDQVVELAHVTTSISKSGEILNEASYILRSKNLSHFTLQLPSGARLWKVVADETEPVVSRSGDQILIPLENATNALARKISVKYTLRGEEPKNLELALPKLEAPTLQTYWNLKADEGQQLVFKNGTIDPVFKARKPNAFDRLSAFFRGQMSNDAREALSVLMLLAPIAAVLVAAFFSINPANLYRWVPLFAALVAVFGIWFTWQLSASIQPAQEVAYGNRELVFQDTVTPARESISVSVTSEPAPEVTRTETASAAWVGLAAAFALPVILVSACSAFLARRLIIPVYGLANVAACFAFLLFANGAAMVLAYLGSALFSPLLVNAARRTWSQFGRRTPIADGSAAGALGAIALLIALAAPEARADSADDGRLGNEFIRSEPIELNAVVNDEYAAVRLAFEWDAKAGESMPILFLPAVITQLSIPEGSVSLGQRLEGKRAVYTLNASRSGKHSISIDYQTPVSNKNGIWTFSIQSVPSLIYRGTMLLKRENCEIVCPAAVGIEYKTSRDSKVTNALVTFQPAWDLNIVCKPKDRDTRLEETVFYAETANAFRPQAGTIEGIHKSTLRIAQGQLRRIAIVVPEGSTITDVAAEWMENWRFDPASRTLTVNAKRPLTNSPSFTFVSQTNAEALPYSAKLRLIHFPQADSELGWIGLYVSPEEQYETIEAGNTLAAVSITDFPAIEGANAGDFRLRRAYRYAETSASLQFALAKVEPEIRVESDELTSLSEDRIVHTATLKTTILRSGLFQIQLELPDDFDVEKISGSEVSHWTDSGTEDGKRIVTLHFKGRTEGETTQYVTLSGAGMRENPRWSPPRVSVRGAAKQRGTLILSPELGLRFDVLERDGVSQIDPAEIGANDRNRLGFRLLQSDWKLALEAKQVQPWVECSVLQDVTFKSGVAETAANLLYSIKNAGVKQLRIRVPSAAVGVSIKGEFIAGYQASTEEPNLWTVNLDRRLINDYRLRIEYQEFASAESGFSISGIETVDTQLQDSFLALRAKQRLDLRLANLPDFLTTIEWQQVPESLRIGISTSATAVYRTLQPRYTAAIETERLDMAQVLPAEIKSVTLSSVLSETGKSLTRAVFRLDSGHKPFFSVRLPEHCAFWSCNVDGMSVWPVEKEGKLLIPLERTGDYRDAIEVEVHYFSDTLPSDDATFTFAGPECDLPLENIEWRIYVPSTFSELSWTGSLDETGFTKPFVASFDLDALLQRDARLESEKLKDAEHLLTLGNALAEEGNQLDARRVLNSAYNLSLGDLDFNEDARVQWNNLRVQQAMVGLTSRRSSAFSRSTPSLEAIAIDSPEEGALNFSRSDADRMLQDTNSAEENRALSELAQRFVQHQDAALRNPSGLTTLYPEHGTLYTFSRKLQAEPWQEMKLSLDAETGRSQTASLAWIVALVAAVAVSATGLAQRKRA